MTAIPFAFSVNHFISSVGADAGFAAILGLAILVLLYFAQARETAALREQAAAAAEQVQELEHRVAELAHAAGSTGSGQAATAPAAASGRLIPPHAAAARAGSGSPVPSRVAPPAFAPAAAPVVVPAAAAGAGAPALGAATRLIPGSDRDPISIRANPPGAMARGIGSAGGAGAAVMAPPAPPPATAAGGANGGSGGRSAAPAPAPGFSGASQLPPRPRAAAPAPRRGRPPRREATGARTGRSRLRRGLLALVAVLGVAAVVVILLLVTAGASSTKSTGQSAGTNAALSARGTRALAAVRPSSVTVAVLNGTSTANLARSISSQLGTAGFRPGSVTNASNQTLTATVVGYLPGHRPAALIVARALKLGSASVQAVDPSNQALACPATSPPCTAQVVVTVGSDLASNT